MGFLAALAVAASAWCATAAAGGMPLLGWHVPTWLFVLLLVPGLALSLVRRGQWTRPRGKWQDFGFTLALLGCAAVVVQTLSNRNAIDTSSALAGAVAAVVLMGQFWPDPFALGVSVLGSLVYVLGARHGTGATPWAVASVGAATVAAVLTARLYAALSPAFGRTVDERRRTARDAAIVLVVVALFGAVLAAVLPSPPRRGDGASGSERGPGTLNPLALGAALDVGAGTQKGKNTVVLRVAAAEPDAWRAGTYETWTGRSWRFREVPAEERDPAGSADLAVPLGPGEVVNPDDRFVQRFTVETDYAEVVVGAPVPTRVVASKGSYVLSFGGLLVQGPSTRKHSSYTVESSRPPRDPQVLRANDTDASPPPELGGYVQLPPNDGRVAALANEIASGAPTPYDKAVAIETWLAANTTLTTSDEAVPRGLDVVTELLFTRRRGGVQRITTSMVVMLRSLGIPARLAIGFRPGERAGPSQPFTVRASDATTWAEVWFPGAGWQRFDPTGSLVARTSSESRSFWAVLWDVLRTIWPLLILAVAALVGWLLRRRARRRQELAAVPWATRYYGHLVRAGAKRDRPRRPHETPVEYTAALAAEALPDPRLVDVGALVTAAAYSRREPSREQQEWAESVLQDLESGGSR